MYDVELIEKNEERDKLLRDSLLSSMWSRGRTKKKDPKQVVYDLLNIQQVVISLLKIHGVPSDLKINIAGLEKGIGGRAGFEDRVNFRNPFILIDKSVYEQCDSIDLLDIYCGLSLHEASHINHTREFYTRWLDSGDKESTRLTWENLLEDERIERKVEIESPGFYSYIQKLKRVLLEDGFRVNFIKLPDLDRICYLIGIYIRMPHLISDEMKAWQDLTEECIFETLRKLVYKIPETEKDVEDIGKNLDAFWRRKKTEYDSLLKKGAKKVLEEKKEKSDGEGKKEDAGGKDGEGKDEEKKKEEKTSREELEIHSVLMKHKKATSDDKELDKSLKEIEGKIEKEKAEEKSIDSTKALLRGVSLKKGSVEKIKRLDSKKDKVIKERREKRFGIGELKTVSESFDKVEVLSSEETKELEKSIEDRLEIREEWSNPDGIGTRRSVVIRPKLEEFFKSEYLRRKKLVAGHVVKMRQVFKLRLGTREYRDTELLEGSFHRRQIAKIPVSKRLYFDRYKKRDKGISICLLLDESGSMYPVTYRDSKSNVALNIAILIAEALKDIRGIELETYSYSSCGKREEDSLLKYLYGKEQPHLETICAYTGGAQNYDHIAIKEAGDLFIKNTTNENRIMLVLADGAPCGIEYGGLASIRATRDSIRALERKGIYVLNIAIESYRSEDMFKHVLKYTELSELINKMRKLITRIVRQASEVRI